MTTAAAKATDLLTRSELIEQLPELGMTDGVDLEVIDEDGEVHRGEVGYSSDIGAFAIMTFGPYGESGQEGITSIYPLPTRATHYTPAGAVGFTKNDDQTGAPESPTRYRIV